MLNPVRRIAYVLIGIGVLVGVYASFRRFKVERNNRRVELVMEYVEIKNLAQLAGQPIEVVLGRFKNAGLTSVSLTEETLTTLEQAGGIRVDQAIDPYSVSVASPEILVWIKQGLLSRGFKITEDAQSKDSTVFEAVTDESGEEASDTNRPAGFAVHADWPTLRPFGIGLDAAGELRLSKGTAFANAEVQMRRAILSVQ